MKHGHRLKLLEDALAAFDEIERALKQTKPAEGYDFQMMQVSVGSESEPGADLEATVVVDIATARAIWPAVRAVIEEEHCLLLEEIARLVGGHPDRLKPNPESPQPMERPHGRPAAPKSSRLRPPRGGRRPPKRR